MKQNNFEIIPPEGEVVQPSGSVYLMDICDRELIALIDRQIGDRGSFRVAEQPSALIERYPEFKHLTEIRLVPEIPELLARQITQFVTVEPDGSFLFSILKIEEPEKYPFLLPEESGFFHQSF